MSSLPVLAGLLTGGPVAIIVKATMVLAAAGLAAVALRHASAAFRHLAWALGLSACAALAVFSPAAPTIAVDVPAATIVERPLEQRTARIAPRPMDISVTPRGKLADGAPVAMEIMVDRPMIVAQPSSLWTSIADYAPAIVVVVWLLGCLAVLVRCLVGHHRINRVVGNADRLTSNAWNAALESASYDLGVFRDIELLSSHEISAPITSGFVRPVVVLPAECGDWSDERRRIVLIHELAHIARLDYLAQLVATFACALFWFHPAVWFAAARLRAEAEHAADDRVIGAGTLGVTYATHLLELARGDSASPLSPLVAVGMIRPSHLEGRFRAMLDSTRSRAAVSPRVQAAAASFMLCAMVPAAGIRTVAHATPERVVQTSTAARSEAVTTEVITAPRPAVVARNEAGNSVVIPSPSATAVEVALADSTFEKTIAASSGDKLSLDLRTGGAIVLRGWDEPRVRLVARLSGRNWRETMVDLARTGSGIRLRSDFSFRSDNQMTSHQFELWVPRHIDVDVSSAGGSITINDLQGDFTGHTGGGGISIERATGRASLATGGGSVIVTNSDLSGSVSTGGGEVSISNVTGGLRGSSGSGSVVATSGTSASTVSGYSYSYGGTSSGGQRSSGTTVTTNDGRTFRVGEGGSGSGGRVSGTTTNITSGSGGTVTTNYSDFATTIGRGENFTSSRSGGITISKAGGQIVLDEAPNGGMLHTGGGRIVVRSSGGALAASTGGGDIDLERVTGDAAASTGAGDVTITVVNANGTTHSIDVSSGKGQVVLELPANLDARFELETAYTDNFSRRTTIESDFRLDQSETRDWDDSFGTPRKFVRARGVVGAGTGLIRVRTVNGDVIVKRR